MKLHEVYSISEDEYAVKPIDDEPHEIAEFIAQYCEPWVNATDGMISGFVWRGIKTAGRTDAFVRKTRTDRKPLHTTDELHIAFNTMLEIAGSKANRTNSAFVTNRLDQASGYGDVYAYFPIGNFDYAWSPRFGDWTSGINYRELALRYLKLSPELRQTIKTIDSWRVGDVLISEFGQTVFQDKRHYDVNAIKNDFKANEGLREAIDSGHEIMIRTDKYLLVAQEIVEDVRDIVNEIA